MLIRSLPVLLTAAAGAQVANGNFESGSLSPWVLTNTAQGGSVVPAGVGDFDIDGPGPLPVSKVASVMVGRQGFGPTLEGVLFSQDIQLAAGITYTLSLNWAVRAYVNVYNAGGGTFEILVNGSVLNQGAAPVLPTNSAAYGQVSASYTAQQTGPHTLSIRITRTSPMGEEVSQFIDNISATNACYPNCDNSTVVPILNISDFGCFLNRFAAGDTYANCDNSTVAPILNISDFGCFLNKFAAGC